MIGLWHGSRNLGAEHVAVDGGRLAEVAHGDGNVIEPADQALASCALPSPPCPPILYDKDVHMADRLFAPALGDRSAHRPPQAFGHLVGVAPPRLRQSLKRLLDGAARNLFQGRAGDVRFR